MDIRLDAAAKRPLYLQLRDQLRARLLSGDFSGAADAATDGLAALESEGATTSEILSEFYALRGAAYQSAGEYAKALSDFSAALSAGYAGVYELQKQSALCAFLLGEYETAESAARAAMQTAGAYFPGDEKDPEKQYSAPKQRVIKALNSANNPTVQ